MDKRKVIKVEEVEGFAPSEDKGKYLSRLLIDSESAGSNNLVVCHFTLMKGMKTESSKHPCPYEEVYHIVRGHAILTVGEEKFDIQPNMVAYIPCDTYHQLENIGNEDLQIVTVMPFHPKEGVNPLYDERKRQWGTSFRLVEKKMTLNP